MEKLPIDARIIAIENLGPLWSEDSPYVKNILSVYLYDKNQHTYICSFTPHYWLIHLYDKVILTEAGEKLPEKTQEMLRDRYEYNSGEDNYDAVSYVDGLEEELSKEKYRYCVYGDTKIDYEDTTYEEQMEALREYFCANYQL